MKQLKHTKGQKMTSAVKNAEVSSLQDGDHNIINALCILTMQQTMQNKVGTRCHALFIFSLLFSWLVLERNDSRKTLLVRTTQP